MYFHVEIAVKCWNYVCYHFLCKSRETSHSSLWSLLADLVVIISIFQYSEFSRNHIRPDGLLALRIAKLISNDFLLWARKDKRRPISIEEALISNRFKCWNKNNFYKNASYPNNNIYTVWHYIIWYLSKSFFFWIFSFQNLQQQRNHFLEMFVQRNRTPLPNNHSWN